MVLIPPKNMTCKMLISDSIRLEHKHSYIITFMSQPSPSFHAAMLLHTLECKSFWVSRKQSGTKKVPYLLFYPFISSDQEFSVSKYICYK